MMVFVGFDHYFTGPIQHDPLAELIFGALAIGLIILIWKTFDMKWPEL